MIDIIELIEDLTMDQILDTPYWSEELKEVRFNSLIELEQSLMKWENILQQLLVTYDYNTFGSYVEFYHNYKRSQQNLFDFILSYQPPIAVESMSCVALSLYLMKSLRESDKHGSMFSLVSCEEMVPILNEGNLQGSYKLESKNNVKEHVMVCIKICVAEGNRFGYVLLDPGYHISRPIVVMSDAMYPHTGWFVAANNGKVNKEYCYQIINDQFVAWKVKETKKSDQISTVLKEYVNFIYIKKEFIKYANVTEKRSLIFKMKSYVIRNRKGAVSGFYSMIDLKNLTIFYEENGQRVSKKYSIEDIDKPEVRESLTCAALFMETNSDTINERVDRLLKLLQDYKESLNDIDFCPDLCEIDKWIEEEDSDDEDSVPEKTTM